MKKSLFYILLIWASIFFVLASCTPEGNKRRAERKIGKLAKKYNLVKTDTVKIDTTLVVPKIIDTVCIKIDPNASNKAVDTLINHFKGKVDSTVLDSLKEGFKVIIKKAGDIDTTITKGKNKYHYTKAGNDIKIDVEINPDSLHASIPVIINKIEPVESLSWYKRLQLRAGGFAMTFVGFFIILLVLLLGRKFLL